MSEKAERRSLDRWFKFFMVIMTFILSILGATLMNHSKSIGENRVHISENKSNLENHCKNAGTIEKLSLDNIKIEVKNLGQKLEQFRDDQKSSDTHIENELNRIYKVLELLRKNGGIN